VWRLLSPCPAAVAAAAEVAVAEVVAGGGGGGGGGGHEIQCPDGLFSVPQCCSVDILGVADLDCSTPERKLSL
jgi:hypothetical protein